MKNAERTLVLLKPDAVARRLVGQILSRFEDKGFQILALKFMKVNRNLAARHYSVHRGKFFYPDLVNYITSGPVAALVVSGKEAVSVVRVLVGPTFGSKAPAGTIRGDFALSNRANLIHASDSPESARREIRLFFSRREMLTYKMTDERWVYDKGV